MRALIIGASSLLGQYMYDFLLKKGYECLGTKLSETGKKYEGCHYRELNLLEADQIENLLVDYQPDYIFNFAAQNSVQYSWDNPEYTVDVNINGVINLFEKVRKLKMPPVIVMLGAGEEYGRVNFQHLPIKENEILHPDNVYAVSKTCQTMMGQIYYKAYGIKVIVARVFNMIGPGQSERFVVSNFCKQVAEIERGDRDPIIYCGNLNIERDFSDVRDVVRACALLAQKGKYGCIYNVASGCAVTVGNIIDMLEKITGQKFKRKIENNRIRPTDIPKLEADITQIKKDTGWVQRISLEKSVKDILVYWRQQMCVKVGENG